MKVSLGLSKVHKRILQLSRQVPGSCRGDANPIDSLRRSIDGFGWSHETLSRTTTYNLSFQKVYEGLEDALQLHKEAHIAQLKDKASHSFRQSDDEIIPVKYFGQGRY